MPDDQPEGDIPDALAEAEWASWRRLDTFTSSRGLTYTIADLIHDAATDALDAQEDQK